MQPQNSNQPAVVLRGRTSVELRHIRRLSVLAAAAGFGASRPDLKSSDVLKIADLWLAWVEANHL